MMLYPKHNIYLSGEDTTPIFKDGEKCALSMTEITHTLHSDRGYINKGVKYMIYNYSNMDHRIEFFIGDDDTTGINSIRDFLKNFMREDEFRMYQIAGKQNSKKLELSK